MISRLLLSALITLLAIFAIYFIIQQEKRKSTEGNTGNGLWRSWVRRRIVNPALNPLLKSLGVPPLWLIPPGASPDNRIIPHVCDLYKELQRTAGNSHFLTPLEKKRLLRQAAEAGDNIVELSWIVARIRRLHNLLGENAPARRETSRMYEDMGKEIEVAVQALENLPVSLLKLELAGEESNSENLLSELQEANLRMRDLAKAHQLINN